MFRVATGLSICASLFSAVTSGFKDYYDEIVNEEFHNYEFDDYEYGNDYEDSYGLMYEQLDMDTMVTNDNLKDYADVMSYYTEENSEDDDDIDWSGFWACHAKQVAESVKFATAAGPFITQWWNKCVALPIADQAACWRQWINQIHLYNMAKINSWTAWTEACNYILNPTAQQSRIDEMYDAYKKENDKIGLSLMQGVSNAIKDCGKTPPNSIINLDDDSDAIAEYDYDYSYDNDETVCTDTRDFGDKICALVCGFIPLTWRWICEIVCRAIHAIWTLVCTAIDFTDVNSILEAVKGVLDAFGDFPVAKSILTGVQNLLTAIGVSRRRLA